MNNKPSSAPQITDIAVYTSTFYDNSEESKIRSKLCIKFLKNLERLGIKYLVAEGGSTNNSFLSEIQKLTNASIIETTEGMGQDRRNGLRKVMKENPKIKYFLWSEPEKDDLMTYENINTLVQSAKENNYDIVVPKRNKGNNCPEFQKWIENRANRKVHDKLLEEGIGENEILDLWFGPKLFNKEGAKYFLEYKSTLDKWDAVIKPVVNALKGGLKIGSVEVDYSYNETQLKNEGDSLNKEIKIKRIQQYREIIKEVLGQDTITL